MYIKTILEKYCFKTLQYLLFVYNAKLYYKIRTYENKVEFEFYTYDLTFVYVLEVYLKDDYIPDPDVLALKIYNKLIEKEVAE